MKTILFVLDPMRMRYIDVQCLYIIIGLEVTATKVFAYIYIHDTCIYHNTYECSLSSATLIATLIQNNKNKTNLFKVSEVQFFMKKII